MWRTLASWVIGLYLTWVVLVILLVWPLLNTLPHQIVREQLQREFSSDLILFNPFTLTLQIHRAELRDSDNSPMLAIERLHANLSLASLWHRVLWLQEVTILAPDIHLAINAEGELNLRRMLPDGDRAKSDEPSGELFPLQIEYLSIRDGRLQVEDRSHASLWRTALHDVSVQAQNLSTQAGVAGHYQLSVAAEEGGTLASEGRLALGDAAASGDLELEALQLAPGVRRADPLLPFLLQAGTLDLFTRFELNWSTALAGQLSGGRVSLRNLSTLPRDTTKWPDTHIHLQALELEALGADLGKKIVHAGTLRLTGLDLAGWQAGETISLLALLPDGNGVTESSATDSKGTSAAHNSWHLTLNHFYLEDSQAHWRSPFTRPALTIDTLNAEIHQLQWPAEARWPVQLNLRINQTAQLDVTGAIHAAKGHGEFEADLQDLPLAWFAPNLPVALRAEIGGGTLGSKARITAKDFLPSHITLDGTIDDFLILIRGVEDKLTSWQQLTWQNLEISLPQQQVLVGSMLLDGFSGRLHIDPQGRVNVTQVLLAADDEAAAGAPAEVPASTEDSAGALQSRVAESTDNPAEGGDPASRWQVAVPEIQVTDSALDFMDESLPIRFRTIIGDLEGSITGFRLDPDAEVTINLSGAVDGYAPVSLEGRALPLRSPPDLQLALDFRGIDMARLSPYSATYAGYAIERGTLTADLNYQLENRRLQGRNQVVISQLRLGEQVDSDRALDLPLRLVIALLTDSRGVIDLDVPVSGNLDNPSFSLGSVIAGAFVNLLRQAVTAPFNLLASLVGSEADLRQVDFAAGSVTLDEHGSRKLEELAGALQQRPALDLIVSGQVNRKTDGRQLREARLQAKLLAGGLGREDIDQRSEAWTQAIAQQYSALQGEGGDGSEEKPSALTQYRAVRDALELPDSALRELASERAASIKRFLVNQAGIAPERVTIDSPGDSDEGSSTAVLEVAA